PGRPARAAAGTAALTVVSDGPADGGRPGRPGATGSAAAAAPAARAQHAGGARPARNAPGTAAPAAAALLLPGARVPVPALPQFSWLSGNAARAAAPPGTPAAAKYTASSDAPALHGAPASGQPAGAVGSRSVPAAGTPAPGSAGAAGAAAR